MTASLRLAIVGSMNLAGNAEAAAIIEAVLDELAPSRVVSGGAVGIDTMAAEAARRRGIEVVEYRPAENNWERGYKPRNLLIAEGCDVLIRIALADSATYGSGWTRDRARAMGKVTREYVVSPPIADLAADAAGDLLGLRGESMGVTK